MAQRGPHGVTRVGERERAQHRRSNSQQSEEGEVDEESNTALLRGPLSHRGQ